MMITFMSASAPPDSSECKPQTPPSTGEGCGHELDFWFKDSVRYPKPPAVPAKPKVSMTLAGMPPACRQVVNAP